MTKKSEFLFSKSSTRFFLPWMCALMVFIATLISAGGIVISNSLASWQRGVSSSLTVQIPTYDEQGMPRGDAVAQDLEQALSLLRTTPGIIGATILNDAEMAELMSPWLGTDAAISELPLPKLIDVTVDAARKPDLEQLKASLSTTVPSAILDSHRIWLDDLITLSNGVLDLIAFVLLMLLATVAITVIYTTKSSLSIQRSIISLVHMMGAKDLYITLKYSVYSFKYAFWGSAIGFALAVPVMLGLVVFLKSVSTFMLQASLSHTEWLALLSIPFGMAVLAFCTTFYTVQRYLKKFL